MNDDGATVAPVSNDGGDKCLGRYKHAWLWSDHDLLRCANCGELKVVKLGMGLAPNSGQTRPNDEEIVTAVAAYFECPESVALSWLTAMFVSFNPKAAAEAIAAR